MTIQNTPEARIQEILKSQREFFGTGATLSVKFRKEQLRKLDSAIAQYEQRLADALWADLHKSYQEAYLTEIGLVKAEIREHLRGVGRWERCKRKHTPLTLFPSSSYIVNEPLGQVLIVSPWNYPVQLLLNPLVGAISAGCTAILKPSPYVPTVSATLEEMIKSVFSENYVAVVQGNREVNKVLFGSRFDMIFFTGSPALGRKVMAAAAEHLTPVVLELGGKSPCIIDKSANLKIAARRIAWGKTLNAGQTCIAPDYILIHEDVKEAFIKEFAAQVEYLHGKEQAKAKTLFATHYHELTDLADTFKGVKNFTVKVKEEGGRVVFLRRIAPGIAEKSFGIHVGAMAGLPKEVVDRAAQILKNLEANELDVNAPQKVVRRPRHKLSEMPGQMTFF